MPIPWCENWFRSCTANCTVILQLVWIQCHGYPERRWNTEKVLDASRGQLWRNLFLFGVHSMCLEKSTIPQPSILVRSDCTACTVSGDRAFYALLCLRWATWYYRGISTVESFLCLVLSLLHIAPLLTNPFRSTGELPWLGFLLLFPFGQHIYIYTFANYQMKTEYRSRKNKNTAQDSTWIVFAPLILSWARILKNRA